VSVKKEQIHGWPATRRMAGRNTPVESPTGRV
jgi:hypothetical protein